MQARQVFGIIVRTTGFIGIVYSTFAFYHEAAKLVGISQSSHLGSVGEISAGAFFLLLGVVIIKSAEWITRFAYGPEKENSN